MLSVVAAIVAAAFVYFTLDRLSAERLLPSWSIFTDHQKHTTCWPLRDFRTPDGECMQEIARTHDLTSTTLQHVKAFLSGIFRYAKRQGVINSENPMRDVVLPKAKPPEDTYAYSLDEITQMLNILPEPAATLVATASYTGVRKGELRGFGWEDYDGDQLRVSQSYWRGHVQEPKTKKSKAPVPVISQLAERLKVHRSLSGNPCCGLMFPGPTGAPINLDKLASDVENAPSMHLGSVKRPSVV
jgi:integrase